MAKKYRNKNEAAIGVREDFVPYGTRTLDSKDRITLGGKLKEMIGSKMDIEGFMVYLGDNGDILLRPSVSVPSTEAWVYRNAEVINSVRKGLKEAGEGKTERARDLKAFLDKL